jgi:hypothetical protein
MDGEDGAVAKLLTKMDISPDDPMALSPLPKRTSPDDDDMLEPLDMLIALGPDDSIDDIDDTRTSREPSSTIDPLTAPVFPLDSADCPDDTPTWSPDINIEPPAPDALPLLPSIIDSLDDDPVDSEREPATPVVASPAAINIDPEVDCDDDIDAIITEPVDPPTLDPPEIIIEPPI